MDLPKPSAAQRRLEAFVGNFTSKETIHPNEQMPQGGMADTTCVGRLVCNGFAVSVDYAQKFDGQVVYSGHGVFRHNTAENVYQLEWFDSMSTDSNNFRGNFNGDVLVMESRAPNPMRLVYDFGLKNGYHFRMEVSGDGVNWKPLLDGDNVKTSMQAKYAKKKKKTVTKKKKSAAKKKTGKKKTTKKKAGKKKTSRKKTTAKKKTKKKAGKKRAVKKRRR